MRINRNRLEHSLLLAGTIGFAILAQVYFFWRREYVWDAVLLLTVALFCFSLLSRARGIQSVSVERSSMAWFQRLRQRQIGISVLVIVLACVLNWMAARSANTQPPPKEYTFSVLLWLVSLLLLLAAVVPLRRLVPNAIRTFQPAGLRERATRTVRRTLGPTRRQVAEFTLVVGLVLIGLVLRAWDLEHIPANLSGDEGTQGTWAVGVLEGRYRNPFTTGWFTVPTMSFFAQAASLRVFGDSVAGLRTISALIGTATLLFTYLMARRALGRRVAMFGLAALTFNHYHIHFSRLGSNQIADPFFMVLTLWLLSEGLRRANANHRLGTEPNSAQHDNAKNPPYWFLAAGLMMGLSWYGYFGSRVILLVVAAYLGAEAVSKRDFLRRNARALALLVLSALMAASPLLLFYAQHPDNLSARFNQVSFFRWLSNELERPDHGSTFSLVWRQVWRSFSAFNHTLDPTYWYRAQIPLLDFVSGILFIFGLLVAILRRRRPLTGLILLWFILAVTLGWVMTENPPSSMRMVIVAPAVALLVALGLDHLLTLSRWIFRGRQAQWTRVGVIVMISAAVLNVHYYFFVYTPTRVYGNPTAETATVLARHLENARRAVSASSEFEKATAEDRLPFVYFYGPPFIYYDFGTIQFIARGMPGVSVPPRDGDSDYETQVEGPTLFVVLRERLNELDAIQARHPNGRMQEYRSEADGRLMFIVYEIRP